TRWSIAGNARSQHSQTRQIPQAETLAEVTRLLFRILLRYQPKRRREVERRQLKIYWTESSRADVVVLRPANVSIRQKILRFASFEVFDGGSDVLIRKVDK